MTAPLAVEEASTLSIEPALRKLLTPQDVARLGVLPLARSPDGNSFTLAADPCAPVKAEMMLRMRLGAWRIELRPATRQAMLVLLDAHFIPYWAEKQWEFPGLPALPEPPAKAASSPAPEAGRAAAAETAPAGAGGQDAPPPVVLVLEPLETRRKALGELFLASGYESRFADSLEAVERELRRSPPTMVVARADGPTSPDALVPLVRRAGASIELRIVRDYAAALLGNAGDDRTASFLFDLVRFFAGIISAFAGAPVHRTEARAQAVERAARHMALPPPQIEAARLAAVFEDLEGHLRQLHASRTQGTEGSEGAGLGQLLDPARTPFPIRAALEERRERFDGSGPRCLARESICPAARILAAVDAFFALKEASPPPDDIEAQLRAEAGKRLDPRAIEAVLRDERAGRLVDRLGTVEERVLVVDPDPVAGSLLEMRLGNSGFQVEVHRDGESALRSALAQSPDLIISEVAVPVLDGFSLLLRLRKAEPTRETPFIFLSERSDRSSSVRGFELGADDFIQKPVDLELLAAKVKGLVRKARARRPAQGGGGGISGSLTDMGLVDVLQVLTTSRKTVRVRVEDGRGKSGELSIAKGRLVDARLGGLSGQEVFFTLASWKEGRFTVRAEEPAREPAIDIPMEALLLEVCRRHDEDSR